MIGVSALQSVAEAAVVSLKTAGISDALHFCIAACALMGLKCWSSSANHNHRDLGFRV